MFEHLILYINVIQWYIEMIIIYQLFQYYIYQPCEYVNIHDRNNKYLHERVRVCMPVRANQTKYFCVRTHVTRT
jgi:hypothetical protein